MLLYDLRNFADTFIQFSRRKPPEHLRATICFKDRNVIVNHATLSDAEKVQFNFHSKWAHVSFELCTKSKFCIFA